MNILSTITTVALMTAVAGVAVIFTQSPDWRDKTLGWIVLIVYISIGAYHVCRLFRKN